jgi:hypothetical protein
MQCDSRNHSTNCQLGTNQLTTDVTNLPDLFNSNILTFTNTSQHFSDLDTSFLSLADNVNNTKESTPRYHQ